MQKSEFWLIFCNYLIHSLITNYAIIIWTGHHKQVMLNISMESLIMSIPPSIESQAKFTNSLKLIN